MIFEAVGAGSIVGVTLGLVGAVGSSVPALGTFGQATAINYDWSGMVD